MKAEVRFNRSIVGHLTNEVDESVLDEYFHAIEDVSNILINKYGQLDRVEFPFITGEEGREFAVCDFEAAIISKKKIRYKVFIKDLTEVITEKLN